MKIVGITGSPRKGSNTDIIVDRVLEGAASKGADIEKICISDLNISYCTGCIECRQTGICRLTKEGQDDDLPRVIDLLAGADGMVLGSPVYGGYIPGRFKNMFDRFASQLIITPGPDGPQYQCRIPGKRNSIVIATCGSPLGSMTQPTLEFLKRTAFLYGNGGQVISEISVHGLMIPAQIIADKQTLSGFAANFNIPDPVVDKMIEQYRSTMEQAYRDGERLASLEVPGVPMN
ncbi:MAG: flavodoxin family protein [ANME-2 cluster archaeon]|nr:flavodoxin family protein [ANME-2 cluster archaeon]